MADFAIAFSATVDFDDLHEMHIKQESPSLSAYADDQNHSHNLRTRARTHKRSAPASLESLPLSRTNSFLTTGEFDLTPHSDTSPAMHGLPRRQQPFRSPQSMWSPSGLPMFEDVQGALGSLGSPDLIISPMRPRSQTEPVFHTPWTNLGDSVEHSTRKRSKTAHARAKPPTPLVVRPETTALNEHLGPDNTELGALQLLGPTMMMTKLVLTDDEDNVDDDHETMFDDAAPSVEDKFITSNVAPSPSVLATLETTKQTVTPSVPVSHWEPSFLPTTSSLMRQFCGHCNPSVRTDLQALTIKNNKTSRRLIEQLHFRSKGEEPTPRYVIRLDRGHAAVFSMFVPTVQGRRFFDANVKEVVYHPHIHYATLSTRGRRVQRQWKRAHMKPGMRWNVTNGGYDRPLLQRAPDKNAKGVPEWDKPELAAGEEEGYAIAARFFNPLREEGIVCRTPTPMFFSASATVRLSDVSSLRKAEVGRIADDARRSAAYLDVDLTPHIGRIEQHFLRQATSNNSVLGIANKLKGQHKQWLLEHVVSKMVEAGTLEFQAPPAHPISVAEATPVTAHGSGPVASTCVFYGRAHLNNRRTNSPTSQNTRNGTIKDVWHWVPKTTCICSSLHCYREVFAGNREKAAEGALNNRAQQWYGAETFSLEPPNAK